MHAPPPGASDKGLGRVLHPSGKRAVVQVKRLESRGLARKQRRYGPSKILFFVLFLFLMNNFEVSEVFLSIWKIKCVECIV